MTALFIIGGVFLTLIIGLLILMFTIKFDDEHGAKIDSWHLKLYKILSWNYLTYDRPKTICMYYWSYILYIVTIPYTLVTVLIGLLCGKSFKNDAPIFGFSLFVNLLLLLSHVISRLVFESDGVWSIHWLWAWLIGLAIMAVVVGLTIGIIYIAEVIDNKRIEHNFKKYGYMSKPKKTSIIKLRLKAWKEKNCPIINWN